MYKYKSALHSTSSSSSNSRSDEASCPVASVVTKLACACIQNRLTNLTRFGSDIPTGRFSNHHRDNALNGTNSNSSSRCSKIVANTTINSLIVN